VTAIAICAHHERPGIVELIDDIVEWAGANGHDAWLVPDDASVLGRAALADERPLTAADLVVALGGDGTMLRAVHLLDGAPTPLLGANLGHLGYLTEVEPDGLIEAIGRFTQGPATGGWHLDERMLLCVELWRGGEQVGEWRALNEAVVQKGADAHTVRLLARIDGEPFTSYAADGLIVATPTGSTAYSLSARGPIVSPRHRALLLTPVAPHMMFDRTLVLDPSEEVELEVLDQHRAEIAVDGALAVVIAEGDLVRCRAAAETASFVRFADYRYHQILKSKFGLMDR